MMACLEGLLEMKKACHQGQAFFFINSNWQYVQ